MFSFLVPYAISILIIDLAIYVHELAHALVGLALGIEIEEFHFGLPFGPELEIYSRGKTTVYVSLMFFGAAVGFEDKSFLSASRRKRLLMLLYGPMGNVVIGLLVAFAKFGFKNGALAARELMLATVESVWLLATLQVDIADIVGPIRLWVFLADVINADLVMGSVFAILLLNIGNGLLNLLPIPPLDGGLMLLEYMELRYTGFKERYRRVLTGLTITLVSFMVFLTGKDIWELLIRPALRWYTEWS